MAALKAVPKSASLIIQAQFSTDPPPGNQSLLNNFFWMIIQILETGHIDAVWPPAFIIFI